MQNEDSPKVVATVPTQIEASAIAGFLSGSGIKATITGSFTAGFQAEAPGWVRVVVRHADQQRAKQLLADWKQADVDWSQVDVGLPED